MKFVLRQLLALMSVPLLASASGDASAATLNEVQKLLASDAAAGDFFHATDIDTGTVVVGARFDSHEGIQSGSAYVFERGNGTWIERQKLAASDRAADDQFGFAVAVHGDTIAIGVFEDDDHGNASGAVWIFTRSAGVWIEQQKLTASDASAFDRFGSSLALYEDTLVVGTNTANAAYVFTRSAGLWTEQQKLTASDATDGDGFGVDVSIHGDTAVVGSFLDDDDGQSSGAAYIFVRSAGAWAEEQKITASDAAAGDQFGAAVAIDGDTAVIGAATDADNGMNSGSAYVFSRSAGVWSEAQKLTASDGSAGDLFGDSVDLDGDTAVIGAVTDDDNGNDSGSAYVFTLDAGTWTERSRLLASDGAEDDQFGRPVSVDGATAVTGARSDDDAGSASGSVYVFILRTVGIDIRPLTGKNKINPKSNARVPVSVFGSVDFDALQVSVPTVRFGPAGAMAVPWPLSTHDVNGDGFADLTMSFHTRETGIQCGDAEAQLTGETGDGEPFAGADSIVTIGCAGVGPP